MDYPISLKQYCDYNGEERLPAASVKLKEDEYSEGITISVKANTETLTLINLIMFDYQYVVINKTGVLWTTDDHVNPKKRSVFTL